MVDMYEQMKEQLVKHGKINPDEELSKREIQKLYMKYQFEMMRADAAKPKPPKKKPTPQPSVESAPEKTISEKIGSSLSIQFGSKLEDILILQKQVTETSNSARNLFDEILQVQYPELAEKIHKLNSWIKEAIVKQIPSDKMNKEIENQMRDIQKRFMKLERSPEKLDSVSDEMRSRIKNVIDEMEQQKGSRDSLTTTLEQKTSEISKIFESEMEV
ncbi:MAG: hypothetical protein RTV31_06510 [Candidatus Thorarchaeota archaeon]